MRGAVHIEMVLLSCLGDWLQDSGWTTALSNAGVTSSGNDSLISGHEVGKTKYVHQVTALTLYQLMKDAFGQSKKEDCTLNFAEWRASKELESPVSVLVICFENGDGLFFISAINKVFQL